MLGEVSLSYGRGGERVGLIRNGGGCIIKRSTIGDFTGLSVS